MSKKKLRKKHTVKKRTPFWKKPFLQGVFLILLFICIVFYFFFLETYFYVADVRVKGVEWISQERLEQIREDHVKRDLFFTYSYSTFLVPLYKIEGEIKEDFYKVKSVDARRVFPDIIEIKIEEREPRVNWCEEDVCFKVDSEGVVFEEGKRGGIVFYKDSNAALGERVVSEEKIRFMEETAKLLSEIDIKTDSFYVRSKDRVDVLTVEGWSAYFLFSDNVERQIDNLNIILDQKIDDKSDLEYIDLRYGDAVYFR